MTRSTQKSELEPTRSTNANYYLKGAVLTGAVALGIAAIASSQESDTSKTPESEQHPTAEATIKVEGMIKGAEDNWGHDTAEKVLLYGAGKATAEAITQLNPDDTTTTANDIVEMVESQERYEKVRDMLEQAAKSGQLPQPGDVIKADVVAKVTEVSHTDGEYNYVVDFEAQNTEFGPPEDDPSAAK